MELILLLRDACQGKRAFYFFYRRILVTFDLSLSQTLSSEVRWHATFTCAKKFELGSLNIFFVTWF